MGARSGIGAADGDQLPVRVAEVDQSQRVGLLRQHSAGKNQIGPGNIVARSRLSIAVDEARRPAGRQHRSDGDQAQRGRRTANSHKIARFGKAPERVRDEKRIEHQYVAAARRVHGSSQTRFPVYLGTSRFILQLWRTSQTEQLIAVAASRLPFKCLFDQNLLRRTAAPYMWVMN